MPYNICVHDDEATRFTREFDMGRIDGLGIGGFQGNYLQSNRQCTVYGELLKNRKLVGDRILSFN